MRIYLFELAPCSPVALEVEIYQVAGGRQDKIGYLLQRIQGNLDYKLNVLLTYLSDKFATRLKNFFNLEPEKNHVHWNHYRSVPNHPH